MKIALITGASSGLGKEYVRLLSRKDNIDEIWAIARREERLRGLENISSLPIRALAIDLTQDTELKALKDLLARENPDIRLLINSAGLCKFGNYREVREEEALGMVDLNCRALVAVSSMALPYMHRGARILQISSTSAFQPFQGVGIYAASKAFVLRYSRALRWELFGRGIRVSAVCPYWIKDTELISIAKINASSQAIRSFPLAGKAKTVARFSLWASKAGPAVITTDLVSTVHRVVAKFIPHGIMQSLWGLLRRL